MDMKDSNCALGNRQMQMCYLSKKDC